MKKLTLFAVMLSLTITINGYAEINDENMPSLAKEIKGALPEIFGSEGFAAAAPGASAGWGELPGGVDIGVGTNTNRDITFAALQTIVPPISPTLPAEPPVNPPPVTPTIPTLQPAPYQGPVLYPAEDLITTRSAERTQGHNRNE